MNILFICSMNQWRSPTAEKIYCRHPMINVRSAGTNSKARRTVSINDLQWADTIFVMENKHKQRLLANFRQELNYKKMIVLDIPDNYKFMDQELIEILKESIDPVIEEGL
ncbi:MAG: protein tyrosine phosphatase [Lentisphaeraceae bacterium]|nr:protein tyrosine phosphatase [Lentisphaeraceae bacterium]